MPPTGPVPSTMLLEHLQLSKTLEAARPLSCRRCVLQQDAAGAATRATEAAQELLRQASRDGQVSNLEGRRLVSCVSSMRLDALPKGSRDELIAYTAFFAALEVSSLFHDQRLACSVHLLWMPPRPQVLGRCSDIRVPDLTVNDLTA